MANIEKRISQDGKTSFRVKVRLKGFPSQSASFERLTDARKWAQQTEAAIREGRHLNPLNRNYTLEVIPLINSCHEITSYKHIIFLDMHIQHCSSLYQLFL